MTTGILSIFALAFLAPVICRFARGHTGWLLALLPATLTIYFATRIGLVAHGERITERLAWVPSLGVELTFYLDGLSLLFALLICGIGALVLIYAGAYLKGREQLGRFYLYLLLFMGAMLGLVLAGNLLLLFVFWELTSISSFLLIGFEHKKAEARRAALQALLITGGGGLALLAGLVLLGQISGGYDVPELLAGGDAVRASTLYLPALLLVLAGAFTKSAQFPFHFWLPGAMQAPTPVSAYLHSATMVKAGVYLLARLASVLGGTDEWFYIVTSVGAATMVAGGVLAFFQTDLKLILAYSTVSALGTLVMLEGLSTDHAARAMVVFLFAHALYKGALFMVAGAIDHETGTRDVTRLGGLRRVMPVTAVAAVIAGVSLAGFGPVFSFIGKELLNEAVLLAEGTARGVLVPFTILGSALFVAVACAAALRPFFGELKETPKGAHEAPAAMWLGPVILAALGLVVGLAPALVAGSLVAPAVASVLGRSEPVELALWHGFNAALLMSVIAAVAGALLFRFRERLRGGTAWSRNLFAFPARGYELSLTWLHRAAAMATRVLQSGYLRSYLTIIVLTTVGLVGYTLLTRAYTPLNFAAAREVRFYEVGVAALILLAALVAVRSRTRLGAVASLGVVGYCVALIFILFGAPDLALTQFLIETLTVILLVLVLHRLPPLALIARAPARARDLVVALLFGGTMTALVLVAWGVPFQQQASNFYAERSYTEAHGRNIVNVILVDFRGLDTLGEITVLSVAAIGVYALLKLRPPEAKRGAAVVNDLSARRRESSPDGELAEVVARAPEGEVS
ncbi:MAG TPA: putative monovalent cation/H+ antiporter subunit A [Pyrinomonadaceae bacterium]|nr:putative monovalent cation/H+ antiporter subunit A [Pyrinomonadaceae bacterium]